MTWGGMGWDGTGRDVTEVERHGTVKFGYPLPEWNANSVSVKLCGAVKHIRAVLLLPSIDAVSSPVVRAKLSETSYAVQHNTSGVHYYCHLGTK